MWRGSNSTCTKSVLKNRTGGTLFHLEPAFDHGRRGCYQSSYRLPLDALMVPTAPRPDLQYVPVFSGCGVGVGAVVASPVSIARMPAPLVRHQS